MSVYLIKIRDDGEYKFGYPYNNEIDELFKPLTKNEIKIYGLTNDEINEINLIKNKFSEFDKKMFLLVDNVATFIDYLNMKQDIVDEYNEKENKIEQMKKQKQEIDAELKSIEQEYEFILNSSNELKENLKEIEKLIKYYKSKLIQIEYKLSDDYEEKTQKMIDFLTNILEEREKTINDLTKELHDKIQKYVEKYKEIEKYDDEAIIYKDIYEKLSMYQDVSKNVKSYFEQKFNEYWTYGESLIFDKTMEKLNHIKQYLNELNEKRMQFFNTKIDEEIELNVKKFSLKWLENHLKFKDEEFEYSLMVEKKNIIENKIKEMEEKNKDAKRKIYALFSENQEANYFKFKEILHKKIKYIYNTLIRGENIDEKVIKKYDEELNHYRKDYKFV